MPPAQFIHRSPFTLPPLTSVPDQILGRAAENPTAIALVDGATGDKRTRDELATVSAAFATGLRARGIGRGDLVAIAMPNSIWWAIAALGAWRAGAALVLLSPLWTAAETARLLEEVRPRVMLTYGELAATARAALDEAGPEAEIYVTGPTDDAGRPIEELVDGRTSDDPPAYQPALDDLAAVPFSSGTGGLPKGIRLTHRNLAAAAATAIHTLSCRAPLDATAVSLACAPWFHAMGFCLTMTAPLTAGARVVTMPVPGLELLLELVGTHRATHVAVPPPVVDALATSPAVARYDVSSLGTVATGGAHVPASVERAAGARLGAFVCQGYGITEATCTVSGPGRQRNTAGTVGWLVAGMEARIVDPATGEDLGAGDAGELLLRGPQIMNGYQGRPEDTAAVLDDEGWMRTGDLVALRPDGQLEIHDRLKELIKVRGASVAPAELELVLREHPAVRDAAVAGRPDPDAGERPVAFVCLTDSVDPVDLAAFVAERLAAYKRPREIVVLDELPRLPSGKIIRRALPGSVAGGRAAVRAE